MRHAPTDRHCCVTSVLQTGNMGALERVGEDEERCPCAMSFVLFAALVVLSVVVLAVLVYLFVRRWL